MGLDDNFDDQEEYSHSGSRGRRVTREDYGKTSDFDTTSLSENGQWFGIKLSPTLAEKADLFYSTALTYLSEYGERWAAKRFRNPAVGNAVAYAIIFGKQGADVGRNLYDSANMLNDMRVATRPLGKSASVAPLSGNNEVIANARAKINGIFWQRILKTAASTIQAAPALINKLGKHAKDQHEKQLISEFEKAKDNPEKQADLLEKELTIGNSKIGFDAAEMEAATEKLITKRRKAYQAKFDEFKKTKEAKEIVGELDDLLKLTVDNVDDRLKKLERHGFGIHRLEHAGDPNKKAAIDAFLKTAKDQKKRAVENLLKKKFVRQHGAFDHEWQEAYRFGEDRYYSRNQELPPTHKDQIEQQIGKLRESQQKAKQEEESGGKDHDGKINEMFKLGSGLGAGIVSEIVTKAIGGKALEEYKKPIALDKILHLRRAHLRTDGRQIGRASCRERVC
ncbi:MAG: hypothetical protein KGI29_10165, partial [Pseudomonadota bacterium]|nr:hypothetical protein [Pseudomonadota bacterium]